MKQQILHYVGKFLDFQLKSWKILINMNKSKALQVVNRALRHILLHQVLILEICLLIHMLKIYQIEK